MCEAGSPVIFHMNVQLVQHHLVKLLSFPTDERCHFHYGFVLASVLFLFPKYLHPFKVPSSIRLSVYRCASDPRSPSVTRNEPWQPAEPSPLFCRGACVWLFLALCTSMCASSSLLRSHRRSLHSVRL